MKRLRSRDIINNRSLSPNRLPDAQSIMPIYIKKRSAPSQAIYKTPEKNYSYIRKNFDLKLPGLSNVEKETIDKIIDTSPNNLGKKMKWEIRHTRLNQRQSPIMVEFIPDTDERTHLPNKIRLIPLLNQISFTKAPRSISLRRERPHKSGGMFVIL